MKKVLVIGGSVFIGKTIAKKFVETKHEVYILNRGNHECIDGAIQLIADRNDKESLDAVLIDKEFDVVVDGSAYELEQTKLVIEALTGKVKHFIHISTAAVYNETEIFPYSEFSARGVNKLWGDYGKNKYEIEEYLLEKWHTENFPATIIRPFYVYGPDNNLNRENYVFTRILNNLPVILPGTGNTMIQFGHVEDLANSIITLCLKPKSFGECYNVSGSEYVTLKGWVNACAKALDREAIIEYVDTQNIDYAVRDWFPFRDVHLLGDVTKIEKHFGVKAKYDLVSGLKNTIDVMGIETFSTTPELSDLEIEKAIMSFKI